LVEFRAARVSRIAKRFCIFIGLLVILVAAGVLLPRWSVKPDGVGAGDHALRILVLSNPIHTDLAIPVDEALKARFAFLKDAGLDLNLPGVHYLIVGWGGRAFYTQTPTWADLKTIPVLKSLSLDSSVMHMELGGDIDPSAFYATAVTIDSAGLERMIKFILQSFQQGPVGPVVLPGAGYGPYDAFFEANGYFNLLFGCNSWTAAALRQAGLTTGWWQPLPWNLLASLRLYNGAGVVAR
jgi:uncharacterized protein (TIGR02117 family)